MSEKSVAECYSATKIVQECHKSRGETVQTKIVEARRPCGQHGLYIVSTPGFTNSDGRLCCIATQPY